MKMNISDIGKIETALNITLPNELVEKYSPIVVDTNP
jgi:hypothetical protein